MKSWPRVTALFEQCVDLPADGQAACLAESGEAPEVIAEVSRLLEHDRASGTFLESMPAEVRELHAPPEACFKPGAILAERYEVLRLMGRGGMGEVYAVYDRQAETTVALKAMPRQRHADLARELRLGRQVTHPHVCRLFDLGFHSGTAFLTPFLTMEYLEGETLAAHLRRVGRLTVAEASPLVEQLVAGLTAIHQAGLVHRDLSPANIMLLPGRAVIMDFGLALAAGVAPSAAIGTLAYMAPEQLAAKPVTPQTDLYSLGAIMREMLADRLPALWTLAIEATLSPEPLARPATARQLLELVQTASQPMKRMPRHSFCPHRRPAPQLRPAARSATRR